MPLQLQPAVPFQTLVLIGGGEFSFGETREIDQLLLARMPADKRTSRSCRRRRDRPNTRATSARISTVSILV
jgi:hypothetical protein